MLDIFIITLFIAVVISNLLKGFKWIEEKFNIYGTAENHHRKRTEDQETNVQSKKINELIKEKNLTPSKKISDSVTRSISPALSKRL